MKILILICLLFAATGCNQLGVRQTDAGNLPELRERADTAYAQEDWATAERAYRQLTEKDPDQAEPWFRLGNIYARSDRLDDAAEAYRNALQQEKDNGKIWHNLGIVYLRQATATFINMLEYTPENDPLNARARQVVNSMSNLLSTGFDAAEK